jgi:hypothetical protein
MGATALASCHLAKNNNPDTHYNLHQQEANYALITATIHLSHGPNVKIRIRTPLCRSTVRFSSKKTRATMSKLRPGRR